MQPLWMAVEKATCKRSTHGCGSLGGQVTPGEDRREEVVRAREKRSQETRRRREAAGAEMNEEYGTRTSVLISQDIPGYAS